MKHSAEVTANYGSSAWADRLERTLLVAFAEVSGSALATEGIITNDVAHIVGGAVIDFAGAVYYAVSKHSSAQAENQVAPPDSAA